MDDANVHTVTLEYGGSVEVTCSRAVLEATYQEPGAEQSPSAWYQAQRRVERRLEIRERKRALLQAQLLKLEGRIAATKLELSALEEQA